MKTFRLAALVAALSFAAASAQAALIGGDVGVVTRLRTYNAFGNGDVILWVQTSMGTCDGFWFRSTEMNGKEIFAQLLAAQRAGSPMYFTAYDDQIWNGSGSRFCKLYSVDTLAN